ncbi:homo-oligomeric flavin containing cys decarboxylase family [Holotrichia oblita]|uniref:Homo-oligomeric flavin containing cys decarboxylase family n=1 Tax=Holotrichia oblita TaxID=644536 RepID=A0ACB9TWE8_HOLOL|nr:homo-oligomeric flavin containing cys decarboxylase family [Holotrichia oblita]
MVNILIGCTGSVATIKLPVLIETLKIQFKSSYDKCDGLCDNLLTCTARAWDISKPLILCPAMNTKMYNHPITDVHLKLLESWGYHIIPVIEKTLMCGDTGAGAMAEVNTIVNYLINICVTKNIT